MSINTFVLQKTEGTSDNPVGNAVLYKVEGNDKIAQTVNSNERTNQAMLRVIYKKCEESVNRSSEMKNIFNISACNILRYNPGNNDVIVRKIDDNVAECQFTCGVKILS